MDREALVFRNQRMAEAFHALPPRHVIRRTLLSLLANAPIPRARTPDKERILLIRPDHLGDVLLTTPAINALRAAWPDAEIHALVGPWSAGVLAGYDALDYVLTLDFPGFSRTPKDSWYAPYQLLAQSARKLRVIGYSSAVILRPDHWWGALLARLAGIATRVGYDLPDVMPFLTETVSHEHQHVVKQSARLIEALIGVPFDGPLPLTFPVTAADRAWVNGYLGEWGVQPEGRIVAVHPGSGSWTKQWTEESWAKTADALSEQLDAAVILTGSDHELPQAQRIAASMRQPACITAGDTQIGALAALFERALVVLGPDSGPLHLAAASGAPTVTLFGPADPVEFGPWGPPERHFVLTSSIGCRPCRVLDWGDDDPAYHPCVREISVWRVLDAARRAVQASRE